MESNGNTPGNTAAAPVDADSIGNSLQSPPSQNQRPGQGQPGAPGQGKRRFRRRRRRGRGRGEGGGGDSDNRSHDNRSHHEDRPHVDAAPVDGNATSGNVVTPPAPNGEMNGAPRPAQQPISTVAVEGILEINDRGNGFLRRRERTFLPTHDDAEVPRHLIDRERLRMGVMLTAQAQRRNGRLQVVKVDSAEGEPLSKAWEHTQFANLTSIDPLRRIHLSTGRGAPDMVTRVLDLVAPIGFGQRGLIVSPPKAGKTILLQRIAHGISENHPEAMLMLLLVDERPEEVTDMKRSVKGEVFASSADRPTDEHLRIAEMVLERSKRMVERGKDVIVLLDSITRLARAYNKEVESSGRTLSGGVDSRALERPKRLFGAARCAEEGGSLTILGTTLVDTGSRMDEVIFEEFKGTGNMEVVLDRGLAEKRIFPAINIPASGTRKEEKLFTPKEYEKVKKLRQSLYGMKPIEAMERLIKGLGEFDSNDEFLEHL